MTDSPVVGSRFIRAADLYEITVCPHRIALDRQLPRERRAADDEPTQLLIDRGLAWEREVAARRGYPSPDYPPGDFARGAAATLELMRQGVPGIYQGVLLSGRHLAIPDLLERVPQICAPGEQHYVPGDVKAGFAPRADQVLQVAFAGWLLSSIQATAPAEGFLVLGDGSTQVFALAEIAHVLAAARARVEAIVDGVETTTPYLADACGRCRWREECVPRLLDAGDLSLVDGVTPTRRDVLAAAGITHLNQLADLDALEWRRAGRAPFGVETLVAQARALRDGQVRVRGTFDLPTAPGPHLIVHAERDPLAGEEITVLTWRRETAGPPPQTRVLLDGADRCAALGEFLDDADGAPGAILHFGSSTARALARLAEQAQLPCGRQIAFDARLVDVGSVLRRGAAMLPVRRYRLGEIAAVLAGEPLPSPLAAPVPAFVFVERLRRALSDGDAGAADDARAALVADAARTVALIARICAFMREHARPGPRGRR